LLFIPNEDYKTIVLNEQWFKWASVTAITLLRIIWNNLISSGDQTKQTSQIVFKIHESKCKTHVFTFACIVRLRSQLPRLMKKCSNSGEYKNTVSECRHRG
jgi:hypothetical protein